MIEISYKYNLFEFILRSTHESIAHILVNRAVLLDSEFKNGITETSRDSRGSQAVEVTFRKSISISEVYNFIDFLFMAI